MRALNKPLALSLLLVANAHGAVVKHALDFRKRLQNPILHL